MRMARLNLQEHRIGASSKRRSTLHTFGVEVDLLRQPPSPFPGGVRTPWRCVRLAVDIYLHIASVADAELEMF